MLRQPQLQHIHVTGGKIALGTAISALLIQANDSETALVHLKPSK